MSLRRVLPLVAFGLAIVTLWIVYAARSDDRSGAALGAGAGAIVILGAALVLNRPFWALPAKRIRPEAAPVAQIRNTALLAVLYAWGGLTLLVAYPLARLNWYHWWQYGGLMLIIAAGLAGLAHWSSGRDSPLRSPVARLNSLRLVILHGMAATAAVGWLVLSGKAASIRDDWLANAVFVAGAIAIAGISAAYAVTERKLTVNGS